MKNKILLLEDNPYIAEDMKEDILFALKKQNISKPEIFITNNIDKANAKLQEIPAEELLCVIADLNMDPTGLSNADKKRSQGGILTGWVFVDTNILKKDTSTKPYIIFHSAFIDTFIKSQEYININSRTRARITLIEKNDDSTEKLCAQIIKLLKRRI